MPTTQVIIDFLSHHITAINTRFEIVRVYVTASNVGKVKERGIQTTPCLVIANKQYTGQERIIQILTPPNRQVDGFGQSALSPEEMLDRYTRTIIETREEDEEEDEEVGSDPHRTAAIQKRMSEFQKRRPKMEGVDSKNRVPGGQAKRAKKVVQPNFKSDDDFYHATRHDNIEPTPVADFTDNADGEAILEEYRNETADMYMPQRKTNNSKKGRRRAPR
jgi:hypothetical protein